MQKSKVSRQAIQATLAKLNLIYSPPKSPQELTALVELWLEDLGGMDLDVFLESVRRHRKASQWFPTPADIYRLKSVVKSDFMAANNRQLPPPPALSDAQVALNLAQLHKLRDHLALRRRMPARGNHD